MALIGVDIFAAIIVLIGFNVAFRHKAVLGMFGQSPGDSALGKDEPDQLASVFRIAGVMLMAFGITICAFANLIAHYSTGGAL